MNLLCPTYPVYKINAAHLQSVEKTVCHHLHAELHGWMLVPEHALQLAWQGSQVLCAAALS